MGLDDRIGPRFLHAGIGYGGSCFPKDVKALIATGKKMDISMDIVEATDRINAHQRERFIDMVLQTLPKNATVGIWGLAFKPKTDDMREAPSLDVIPALVKAGHTVKAFDPEAIENTKSLLQEEVTYCKNALETAAETDAVILLTEWDEFRGVDLGELAATMKGTLLIDGRNVYGAKEVEEAGLMYRGIGIGNGN